VAGGEGGDDGGVELAAVDRGMQEGEGLLGGHVTLVGTADEERVVDVGDGEDASAESDGLSGQGVRVARTGELLVVLADDEWDVLAAG